MAIGFVGDIHGSLHVLRDYVREVEDKLSCLIQVGEFGVHPNELKTWAAKSLWKSKIPVYFIDGNHEYFETFYHNQEVTEILPNLFYVPRGTVMEIDGKKIAFLGGASSIDKAYRLKQKLHWDDRENILPTEVLKLYDNVFKDDRAVDILVTHIPPHSIIETRFDPRGKLQFDVPITWTDLNGKVVEEVWNKLGRPMMYCGHMHKSVLFDNNSRVLDINELFVYPSMYSEEEMKVMTDKASPKGIIIAH